jgi:hypothetical protein
VWASVLASTLELESAQELESDQVRVQVQVLVLVLVQVLVLVLVLDLLQAERASVLGQALVSELVLGSTLARGLGSAPVRAWGW